MGPRMEQDFPSGVCNGSVCGPALLLHTLRKRVVHVCVRRWVVSHHSYGDSVFHGCVASMVAVQDEQVVEIIASAPVHHNR